MEGGYVTDYSHTLKIERVDSGWYSVTYKVSDGFKNTVVMDESSLTSLYNLIGRVIYRYGEYLLVAKVAVYL